MQKCLRRRDLMKADLFSEILLLASGVVLFLPLLAILVMSLAFR